MGVEQVRSAARKGTLWFAVVAHDASVNSLQKVVPLLRARRIRYVEGPSAAELGGVTGRESTVAIGITDRQLARGIRAIVDAGASEGNGEEGLE